jgi:hypothetical protein
VKLSAQFSDDLKYRYTLERHWSPLVPPLIWILLNPSTADAFKDDPTIRRCIEFSINSGFGGCLILNLFAWRSTNPGGLLKVEDPVGPENDGYIKHWVAKKLSIVCGWGCMHKKLLWRPLQVLEFLERSDLYYLRPTNVHHEPNHPLYLPSKLRPIPMDRGEMMEVYERRKSA